MLNWTDLREHQVVEIHADTASDLQAVQDETDERYERLTEIVPPRVPEAYASIVDDVVADLSNCAYFGPRRRRRSYVRPHSGRSARAAGCWGSDPSWLQWYLTLIQLACERPVQVRNGTEDDAN